LELIDRVPIFAPLSLVQKERLAADLVDVSPVAGQFVIRVGEAGDRFYIVAEGELELDADGRHSTLRRADYFGEIALLRDVPRTASVKASTDSRLFALRREDFLAAVTGHPAADAAGQAVADERLAQSNDRRSTSVIGS
jgi:CRP-like cAMP-binding protein